MRFQLEVEAFLPKHFMLEWDCVADYPYTQLYPTEEMEQEARKKPGIEELILNNPYSLWTSTPFCDIVCTTKTRRQYT